MVEAADRLELALGQASLWWVVVGVAGRWAQVWVVAVEDRWAQVWVVAGR